MLYVCYINGRGQGLPSPPENSVGLHCTIWCRLYSKPLGLYCFIYLRLNIKILTGNNYWGDSSVLLAYLFLLLFGQIDNI